MREEDDISVGFDGFSWHTHGDLLAGRYELSVEDAVQEFIRASLGGQLYIAVLRAGPKVVDVWITDGPDSDDFMAEDETMELRFWDGRPAP